MSCLRVVFTSLMYVQSYNPPREARMPPTLGMLPYLRGWRCISRFECLAGLWLPAPDGLVGALQPAWRATRSVVACRVEPLRPWWRRTQDPSGSGRKPVPLALRGGCAARKPSAAHLTQSRGQCAVEGHRLVGGLARGIWLVWPCASSRSVSHPQSPLFAVARRQHHAGHRLR